MSAPLTLYLIRHGEVHNPEGILYGRLPGYHLSEAGREQAAAAADHLSKIELAAISTSPMQRTQETSQIIASQQASKIRIKADERLIEVNTPHQGTKLDDLEKINFDLYTGNEPPYERPRDVRRRLQDFVLDMRRKHAGEAIAAISHGDSVVTMFMFAKGQDEDDIGRSRTQPHRLESLGLPEYYPATASISKFVYTSDDPEEIPSYTYIRPYDA